MSNNEIRLRKQLSSGRVKSYRNYSALMRRHKRDQMIKRAWNLLLYFVIVVMLMILAFFAVQYVKKQQLKRDAKKSETTAMVACHCLDKRY